ncbi:MAG: GtrA family protein [Sphingobacteriales bacterium]|nr:MAG: GtrA family protein [Sphingobacteriales bacterium]
MSFLSATRRTILTVIDFVHRPFARWIDPQTFRYLASGGSNALMNLVVYFIAYNFVLHQQPVTVLGYTIAPHVGAFVIAFCISFPYGFLMSRYVVFTESNLRGRVQLFRYSLLVLVCIWLNYILIKLFVESMQFFPSIANAVTQAIVALFSYTTQRFFTFRSKPTDPLTEDVFLEGETDVMEV